MRINNNNTQERIKIIKKKETCYWVFFFFSEDKNEWWTAHIIIFTDGIDCVHMVFVVPAGQWIRVAVIITVVIVLIRQGGKKFLTDGWRNRL